MTSLPARSALLVLAATLTGCPVADRGARRPLDGRDLYLCCTLRFDRDHAQTDANYSFQPQTLLVAGTRVRVVRHSGEEVAFQPVCDATVYRLAFRFGRGRMSSEQWFALIFRDADPRPALGLTPSATAAIDEGRIEIGMTKPQVLAARGYPPFHQTASTDADRWLYFSSSKVVNEVGFVDGLVATIVNGPAPGS